MVAAFIGLIWWLVDNTVANLARQNVATGFGFLDNNTGFDINQKLIAYDETSSYQRLLLVGLLNTAIVSVLGILFATLIGFMVGLARLSDNWLVSKLAFIYVEIFRNLPLLIQILFWYVLLIEILPHPKKSFGLWEVFFLNNRGLYLPWFSTLPGGGYLLWVIGLFGAGCFYVARKARNMRELTGQTKAYVRNYILIGVICLGGYLSLRGVPFEANLPALKGFNFRGGLSFTPEFVALLVALSLYTASFIAEIVRAGVLSVSKGQFEATKALGLPSSAAMNKVIIPQAMRVIIPPLTSQYLNLTKNSSLAAAIAYPELVSVFAGTALNQTGQAVEIIFITMSIYLFLSLLTSFLMNTYNARVTLVEK
jgi:general L-amino acid transport system permease protein